MANGTKPLWSTLSSQVRVEKIMAVVTAAVTDQPAGFRAKVLNETTRQQTIEDKAQVQFDSGFEIQCYTSKGESEKQIVLLLPDKLKEDGDVTDYWLCTYVDYIPK
jgi:hypothetical protein